MKSSVTGNLAMGVSKFLSGLNQNALRYLLPKWMDAYTGVLFRLGFGAIAFWIMGLFTRRSATKTTARQKLILFGIGAIFIFGYMITLLGGLSYTTPISSSIFICLEPVWVFIMSMIFFKEKATVNKILGIALGFAGAMICVLTQRGSAIATNPMLGNLLCAASSVMYAGYLVASAKVLKGIDKMTVSKWTFTGGAFSAVILICFVGFDAPVLHKALFSTPMLVLLYVLIFPSCLSYLFVDIGLQKLNTTVVSLYGYVILIVSTIAGYILGQDRFSWFQLLAMVMIVSSVYFVEIAESSPDKPKVVSNVNNLH